MKNLLHLLPSVPPILVFYAALGVTLALGLARLLSELQKYGLGGATS